MPARPVFRARRNAFIDRILRSAYAKGRARGLVSGGWWLLPGGQAVGHDPPRRSSRNFRHLSPTGRGRARHLNLRSHALGSRGTSVTIRFNRMFYHMRIQHSHMRMPVLISSRARPGVIQESWRPLSPSPYNVAVPKGPAFSFLNYYARFASTCARMV